MRYSPVQVKNPTSQHHLVRLLPDQELVLTLSRPEYRNANISVRSDFVFTAQDDDDLVYFTRKLTFRQKAYMPTAGLLGEITVESPILSSRLVVYVEGQRARPKKQLLHCPVTLSRKKGDMETDCNVIFSRCY